MERKENLIDNFEVQQYIKLVKVIPAESFWSKRKMILNDFLSTHLRSMPKKYFFRKSYIFPVIFQIYIRDCSPYVDQVTFRSNRSVAFTNCYICIFANKMLSFFSCLVKIKIKKIKLAIVPFLSNVISVHLKEREHSKQVLVNQHTTLVSSIERRKTKYKLQNLTLNLVT